MYIVICITSSRCKANNCTEKGIYSTILQRSRMFMLSLNPYHGCILFKETHFCDLGILNGKFFFFGKFLEHGSANYLGSLELSWLILEVIRLQSQQTLGNFLVKNIHLCLQWNILWSTANSIMCIHLPYCTNVGLFT